MSKPTIELQILNATINAASDVLLVINSPDKNYTWAYVASARIKLERALAALQELEDKS